MKTRKEENDTIFTQDHSQINNLEQGRNISTNFTCHSWARSKILICTDNGEMLLCANNGEYKAYILDSPLGFSINTVYPFEAGFIVCAENNLLRFVWEEGDERAPLTLEGPRLPIQMKDSASNQLGQNNFNVLSITATEDEDRVYAITSHGQLVTAPIDLKESVEEESVQTKFDYVLSPFHRSEITGLDICIRKELIATCSKDKTVNIWNYETMEHEISQVFPEECLTVAFHPSGLHIIIALQDKVQMCNILSNSISIYKLVTIKSCNEIRFCNGGHLFACVAGVKQNEIYIFNFYTGETNERMNFTGHQNNIMSIDWFANDMGFTTCG